MDRMEPKLARVDYIYEATSCVNRDPGMAIYIESLQRLSGIISSTCFLELQFLFPRGVLYCLS